MKLYGICPHHNRAFASSHWEIIAPLELGTDIHGAKQLSGAVSITCPLCGTMHVLTPQEFVCPLARSTTDEQHIHQGEHTCHGE